MQEGERLELRGWVYRIRKLGDDKIFIVLRDARRLMQGVLERKKVSEDVWRIGESLYIESSILMGGTVVRDQRAPGGYEIKIDRLEAIHVGEPFPISKDQSEEFLLDNRHLWVRSQRLTKIFQARHYLIRYLEEYLHLNGFYRFDPPIITASGAEGGADMFELDYFGNRAYLTQSSQMYGEAGIFALERVYTLAPSFRAERSRTRRHLAEYWHLEPEAAFVDWEGNMKIQEGLIEYAVQKFLKEHPDLVDYFGVREKLEKITSPFPRLTYYEAVDLVNRLGGKMEYGEDFGADEEALISSQYQKPVFIIKYPKKIKAFYMREDPDNPELVLNDDMIAPYGHGEIIGGSERIWKLEELKSRMREVSLPEQNYAWYLDLRRFGSVPHSGFGLGIERFIKFVLDLDHIRDAIPFPRTINRYYP
ncbi:MAG: asparagine--tRNA ligase [Candidatus Micrarchaeota archaeon]|nr:asparagine--tRNA ligase [Candidatus Micrarchaeota archaeon]